MLPLFQALLDVDSSYLELHDAQYYHSRHNEVNNNNKKIKKNYSATKPILRELSTTANQYYPWR